jgi:hypothetical protein
MRTEGIQDKEKLTETMKMSMEELMEAMKVRKDVLIEAI